jgi:hypothetical protein
LAGEADMIEYVGVVDEEMMGGPVRTTKDGSLFRGRRESRGFASIWTDDRVRTL